MMSEIYMEEFSSSLIKMIEKSEGSPYEVGYFSHAAVRKLHERSIDLSWYPNTHTRFHEVSISLPRDKFKLCIDCWQYDINSIIFVDDEWLEQLYTKEYSVFALVDAIDAKIAIRNNLLTKDKLLDLRHRIDLLSAQHRDVLFISFADTLILKSNWSVGYFKEGIECSYEPEVFIRIVKKIQEIYREVLNLEIFAVLTQGSNEYYGEPLHSTSDTKNHICLNSLGVPFAELKAIEITASKASKGDNKVHPRAEIYMDEQYYHSLNFKFGFDKNKKPKNSYKAIMKSEEAYYFYSSCNELLSNLNE
ncbi:MAG: hypothetical protein BMS9Abin11_0899 [Gammaproteobacteria bacterium]|nr:MAG: hypothetical protein BMS9Abin11_0899 [Gammaproteobacteria bacterium]